MTFYYSQTDHLLNNSVQTAGYPTYCAHGKMAKCQKRSPWCTQCTSHCTCLQQLVHCRAAASLPPLPPLCLLQRREETRSPIQVLLEYKPRQDVRTHRESVADVRVEGDGCVGVNRPADRPTDRPAEQNGMTPLRRKERPARPTAAITIQCES